jgi:hypothetical protein
MFAFPPQTAFGKPVPKSRIYTHATLTRRVKDLFVSQVAEIVWAHKLSPETLHLPARPGVPEILVFDLHLKGRELDGDVLHAIDRAIPFPIFHRLHRESEVAFSAAYKLPTALDLGHLYAALFAPLLPLPPRAGEDLPSHLARCEAFLRLRRQADQLTAKLHREKHFARKVELNQQLRPLQAELTALSSPDH